MLLEIEDGWRTSSSALVRARDNRFSVGVTLFRRLNVGTANWPWVGMPRLALGASRTRTVRSSSLSYIPKATAARSKISGERCLGLLRGLGGSMVVGVTLLRRLVSCAAWIRAAWMPLIRSGIRNRIGTARIELATFCTPSRRAPAALRSDDSAARVGMVRFERTTFRFQAGSSSRLSYTPLR